MRSETFRLHAADEFTNVHADVARDLSEHDRRDVTPGMKRHRRHAPIAMSKLLVRASLADLHESEPDQDGDDVAWLQDRNVAHAYAT